ncbi:MAG TPA: leucyl/phenylalanyl-tRNA--protein transferase [Phenylobacterium sp.]|nr:leucyl/phenylalanyl-tRNA--protein transferase [Phenylobacterium sp.]
MRGFDVHDLIAAYERGVFPMADARDDERVFLVDPERRGVIPLDGFRTPRRLARTVRADPYVIRTDSDFRGVVAACAEATSRRPETWINAGIEGLYCELFDLGCAHSVECWLGDELVGGLYGVSLGGAFFGESMFSRARDASKVALVHLVARLRFGGYRLLDAQFTNEHLKQFGLIEIAREIYHRQLGAALAASADFQLLPAGTAGGAALQLTSQAS